MRNGAPFSKPRVRLYGKTGDAQNYLGAAYNLLFKVRQFCEQSGASVFALQHALENGAVVRAAILGDEEIVSCFPPTYAHGDEVLQPDETPPPRFYMDFGWLKHLKAVRSVTGVGDANFTLKTSSKAKNTFASVWKEETAKKQKPLFKPYADEYDEQSGKCFGRGYAYEGEDGEKQLEADVRKMKDRVEAGRIGIRTTGLLRVWSKALSGRDLRTGPEMTYELFMDTIEFFSMAGVAGDCKTSGVFLIETTFFFVTVGAKYVQFQELSYPKALEFLVLRSYSRKGVERLACLAYALSYCEGGKSSVSFRVKLPKKLPSPQYGWFFSHFSNQFACTSRRYDDEDVIWYRTTEVTLTASGVESIKKEYDSKTKNGANNPVLSSLQFTTKVSEESRYNSITMPFLWEYILSKNWTVPIRQNKYPKAGESVTPTVFYDIDDNLCEMKLGNTVYEPYKDVDEVDEYVACGEGVSFKRTVRKAGIAKKGYTRCAQRGYAKSEEDIDFYSNYYSEQRASGGQLRMDSSALRQGGCNIQFIDEHAYWFMQTYGKTIVAPYERMAYDIISATGWDEQFVVIDGWHFRDGFFSGTNIVRTEFIRVTKHTGNAAIVGGHTYRDEVDFVTGGYKTILVAISKRSLPHSSTPDNGAGITNYEVKHYEKYYGVQSSDCVVDLVHPYGRHRKIHTEGKQSTSTEYLPYTSINLGTFEYSRPGAGSFVDGFHLFSSSFHGEVFWILPYAGGVGFSDDVCNPLVAKNTIGATFSIGFQ